MNYSVETIKGISWVGALRGVTRAFSFLRIVIIARLLTPSQFGVFGIASFVLALVEVFTETGINIFLVQRSGNIDKFIDSAWIVSIGRGIVISLFILIAAPFISSFFNSPDSLPLLLLIAVVPIIKGFINPSIVSFQKDLNFNKEFYFRSVILFFETLTSILFVYLLKDPSGLVWGLIMSAIVEVILSFYMVKPWPSLKFKKERFFEVFHSGKWVTVSTIFTYLYQNVDDMVVGKLLNTTSLGLYQMAYKISMLPITEVADVIARVTFPVYAKISNDKKRLRMAFIKTSAITFFLILPIIFIFLIFPEEIVNILLGSEWIGVVSALQILVFFGFMRALSSPAMILLLSIKRQDIVAKLSLLTFFGMAITIIPLVESHGIFGAGLSSVIGSAFSLPFAYFYALKKTYE